MTLVAFCAPSLPQLAPKLRAGTETFAPIGGMFEPHEDSRISNYLIYSTTADVHVDVVDTERRLGAIIFDAPSNAPRCDSVDSEAVRLIACESILVVEWKTDISASEPPDVRGSITDSAGHDLGFYVAGKEVVNRRLVLTVGFQWPTGNEVDLAVTTVNDPAGVPSLMSRAKIRVPAT